MCNLTAVIINFPKLILMDSVGHCVFSFLSEDFFYMLISVFITRSIKFEDLYLHQRYKGFIIPIIGITAFYETIDISHADLESFMLITKSIVHGTVIKRKPGLEKLSSKNLSRTSACLVARNTIPGFYLSSLAGKRVKKHASN